MPRNCWQNGAEDTQATDAELEESYRIALGWAKMSGQGG